MSANSQRMLNSAISMIRRGGATVTLARITPGTYDPGTLQRTGDIPASITISAVPAKPTRTTFADGSTVTVRDRAFLIAGPEPVEMGDVITHAGVSFTVAALDDVFAGDVLVMTTATGKRR